MFPIYPYINVNDLNLDYLQRKVKELEEVVKNFVSVEGVKIADPIAWNITTQYAKNTVVLDSEGNAYLSLAPVPAGILLNNTDYWLVIFNFMDYIKSFNSNVTIHEERNTTKATAAYSIGDWLLIDDLLYVVAQNIAIGDDFEEGVNINRATIEDVVRTYKNDIDASELAYRNVLAQDVADTVANLQAQLNAAISGVTVDSEVINARVGADGTTYSTLGDAIRTQITNKNVNKTFYENGDCYESILSFIDTYFMNGDIDGALIGSAQYRVINTALATVTEDTELYIKPGFRIYLSFYVGGTYDHASGWKTASYTIPANSTFRIMIARTVEDVSETAPVDEFTAAVYRPHALIMEDKLTIRPHNGKILPGTFTRGAFANDGSYIATSIVSYRVISTAIAEFAVDTPIYIAPGFRAYLSYYDAGNVHTGGSGWKTDSFTVPANQKFYIMIARSVDNGSEFADLSEFVSAITIDSTVNVPNYWNDELATKEQSINNHNCDIGADGTSFVFFTDYHKNTSNGKTLPLIKHILEKTSVAKVFYGGDTSDGVGLDTQQKSINMLRDFGDKLKKLTPYWIRGNHDVEPTSGDTTTSIPDNAFYDIAIRPIQSKAVINKKLYYYSDDSNIKFRYITLDTGNGDYNDIDTVNYYTEQMNWLKNRLLELDSGWTVVIFQHIFFTARTADIPTLPRSNFATDMITAINDVFANLNCTIACIVSGHVHRDYSYITGNGVPCIATTCDTGGVNASTYDPDNPTRTPGTITEHAFDVYSIDTTLRKIYITRIGAGNNREFTY